MNAHPRGSASGPRPEVLLALAVCAALFLALLSGAAAGNAGAAATVPDRTTRANGVGAAIAWTECDPPGSGVQCATIRVPLD
jgi:hypothetical protein